MYQRIVEQAIQSNRLLGATTPEKVADKVVDAIRRNRSEVIESGPDPADCRACPTRPPGSSSD
jgi:hypothetical protein